MNNLYSELGALPIKVQNAVFNSLAWTGAYSILGGNADDYSKWLASQATKITVGKKPTAEEVLKQFVAPAEADAPLTAEELKEAEVEMSLEEANRKIASGNEWRAESLKENQQLVKAKGADLHKALAEAFNNNDVKFEVTDAYLSDVNIRIETVLESRVARNVDSYEVAKVLAKRGNTSSMRRMKQLTNETVAINAFLKQFCKSS